MGLTHLILEAGVGCSHLLSTTETASVTLSYDNFLFTLPQKYVRSPLNLQTLLE
jgi:hypothetical protein